MKVFVTGASGYIGGSIAHALIQNGHSVAGLVRTETSAAQIRDLGLDPVLGSLDEAHVLVEQAERADAVIHTANADHRPSVEALCSALAGSGKALLHTSGSSIVGTQAGGRRSDDVFDEATPFAPSPGRAARVTLNEMVLGHRNSGFRPAIICPSLIYGNGRGAKRDSMQIPWLLVTAKKHGVAKHFGPGTNIWSNVHIDDLVDLFVRALDAAPAGAFYFAEAGEASMREICETINRMLGIARPPEAMALAEAAAEWGEGAALNTMGSNSRVRAVRARAELGWQPSGPSLEHEILHGCYRAAT